MDDARPDCFIHTIEAVRLCWERENKRKETLQYFFYAKELLNEAKSLKIVSTDGEWEEPLCEEPTEV